MQNVLSLGCIIRYWVNSLWINYADWQDLCWLGSVRALYLFITRRKFVRQARWERERSKHTPKELWHDVSLLKLLLHCFTPHVPYPRWQLTVLFVLLYHKRNEIKIHNKMHFYSEMENIAAGFWEMNEFPLNKEPSQHEPLTDPHPFINF